MPLRFALHIGKFAWPGGGPQLAENLRRVGAAAEEAGFDAISVMDHIVQIPPPFSSRSGHLRSPSNGSG